MAYHVRKVKEKRWAIVNSLTGHVAGYAPTKTTAQKSAAARSARRAGTKGKGKA